MRKSTPAPKPIEALQNRLAESFERDSEAVLLRGDAIESLKGLPAELAGLVITSPPYNLGKCYETATGLLEYLNALDPIVDELVRLLSPHGSLCWQVGNYVEKGEVFPLDMFYYHYFKRRGLKLRNRIIWRFGHGLHASKRFSGRYEVILWFTKTDNYIFNLDPVRVPSKYPGKTHFKGEKRGLPSGNPLGKNPSDIWTVIEDDWEREIWDIPNVKANHPEKTDHPCQFPIELVERCVLALTNEQDWVLDPFCGAGSTLIAALINNRRAIGCEKEEKYLEISRCRIEAFYSGDLRYRRLGKAIHEPTGREKVSRVPAEWLKMDSKS